MRKFIIFMTATLATISICACVTVTSGKAATPFEDNQAASSLSPEMNKHKKFDIDCESCHADKPNEIPEGNPCITCHGDFDEMAKTTEKYSRNPHRPHDPILCTNCHAIHRDSENFCIICHDDGFMVP